MSLDPVPPKDPKLEILLSEISARMSPTSELLERFEEATPGMRQHDQFSAVERRAGDILFDEAKRWMTSLLNGPHTEVLNGVKYALKDTRIVQDPMEVAGKHNLKAAIIYGIQTPLGQYVYGRGIKSEPTTLFASPVYHIHGRTMDEKPFFTPSLSTLAYEELIERLQNLSEAHKEWPNWVYVKAVEVVEIAFRGGPRTNEQRRVDPLIINSIKAEHGFNSGHPWMLGTNEGRILTGPSLNSFGDFELRYLGRA